ncbi:hypothetical protein HGB25_03465 [Candidatus Saccharibacteria bacterium]|nr:hypothetical protein [Candidatus Saccharibacteria bacterium]
MNEQEPLVPVTDQLQVDSQPLIQPTGEFAGAIANSDVARIGADIVQTNREESAAQIRANGEEQGWTPENTEATIRTVDSMRESKDNNEAEVAMATELAMRSIPDFEFADKEKQVRLIELIRDKMKAESMDAKNEQKRAANSRIDDLTRQINSSNSLNSVFGDFSTPNSEQVETQQGEVGTVSQAPFDSSTGAEFPEGAHGA